ncbi:polysaccharide deacetylase family protein [Kitasatospora sp. NPDC059648]|uniref:polysaccharide deacetylase family protein n=1 Tax=Kitasatospora sp. NPDC059648 TaxID=3346894 RepID=UPI0036B16864
MHPPAILGIGAAVAAAATATHAAPAISTYGPLRNRLMPRLAGEGRPDHVALTFDGGPDPVSTPYFLTLLQKYDVRATFFLLGSMAERTPALVREIADAGHEIAVRGWGHRPLVLRGPRGTHRDLRRTRDAIADLTGTAPRWFRPPSGIMTVGDHLAARRLGLTPVLWTSRGEDWTTRTTPESIHHAVTADLHGGGTILLHDCGSTSVPAAWQSTLGAMPHLLDHCATSGWEVGPLRDHGVRRGRREGAG